MAQLRIALAQVDPTVGDLDGNAELVVDWTRRAAQQGAHLVVFPEMTLTGYPVEDLALRGSFVEASRRTLVETARWLAAEGLGDVAVVVGYLDRREDPPLGAAPAGAPQNAAALLYDGRVAARYAKHHLPNYGVFDESRYFVPGDRLVVFRLHGVDVALAICEDLWQDGGPVAAVREAGAELLVVPNASPYELDKGDARLALARRRADEAGVSLAYVNMIGGQDELVFDGGSFLVDAGGELRGRAARFDETCLLADLDLPVTTANASPEPVGVRDGTEMSVERITLSAAPLPPYDPRPMHVAEKAERLGEVYAALVTGTRDYARKNGFGTAILGLSGGIDSALTATIAAEALGAEQVHAVLMPSRHSSEHSVSDAEDLAARQGLRQRTVPVTDMVEAYEKEIELHGVAAENLQARVRGTVVMSLSNEHGHVVLATGNKSELAVGYSTLYGDTVGGFAPLKDVPKTMVWQLARWRNDVAAARGQTPPIPPGSITKAPSAELRPGQVDTDALPEYAVLDPLLDDYIEKDMGRDELIAAGHDPDVVRDVLWRVDGAEYKRRQYPPGPKISLKAFGRDRRLPISSRWREPGVGGS